MSQQSMHKYMAYFNGKQKQIDAIDLYNATIGARIVMKVPKSKQGLLSVVLVELADGTENVISTSDI